METIKQHKLIQERDALLKKNEQLKAEWHELSRKAEEDYTTEDIWRVEELDKEIPAIASRLQEIDRKLEMYDVVCDCLDEFKRAEEAKKV